MLCRERGSIMKRLFALLLVFVFLFSFALAGCDGLKPGGGTTTTTGGGGGAQPTVHVDENNDDRCDDCGESVVVVIDIYAINDLHGKLCDSATQPGVDELTTFIKNAHKTEEHVLLLSLGDMWQGSSESNLTRGLMMTDWMNELGFASMTLGNHEFDWGEEYIEENAALAEFPFLAINVYDRDTNKLADYCTPSVMVQKGGATIGIIGAIGDCYSSISGEHSGGVYFKVGDDLTDLVKAESERLRAAGADFIIYSIHDGIYGSPSGELDDEDFAAYYDTVLSDGYVDLVFEGHTHCAYAVTDSEGVYHLQNDGDNGGISYAEAKINFANGKSDVRTARHVDSWVYASLDGDPIVDELMDKYEDQVSEGERVLGQNDRERSGNELRQLVADLYLKAGLDAFGEDYDIVLGGGYISVRSPGRLPIGQVTFSQVQGLFPFENRLVLCSVKGSDLLRNFINTTNENYFVSYSEWGWSVHNNINPTGTYYIITDTYSSTYGPNNLTEIERYTADVFAQDLLAKYIEDGNMEESGGVTYTPITEILEEGNRIPRNHTTIAYFYVKGTVVSFKSTIWGNLYIADEAGNRLYIYGTYDSTGNVRYDAMENPPQIGDTVVLYGQITHYYNPDTGEEIVEIKNARLIEVS